MTNDSLQIAVLADCHIDHGHHGMNAEAAWLRACEDIAMRQPAVAIVAGDMFHTGAPSGRAIVAATNGVGLMAKAGVKVLLLAGNHEWISVSPPGDQTLAQEAIAAGRGDVLSLWEPAHMQIGDLQIVGIPWIAPGTEMGTYEQQIQRIADVINPELPAFCAAHAMARGVKVAIRGSEVELAALAGEETVATNILDQPEVFRHTALGHIHKRQSMSETCGYVGSTDQITFGDEGQAKGYSLFTWEETTRRWLEELVVVGQHTFYTVNYDTDLDGLDDGSFLRLRLRPGEILNPEWQRAAGNHGHTVQKIDSPTLTETELGGEVFAEIREHDRDSVITAPELLQLYLQTKSYTDDDKAAITESANEAFGWDSEYLPESATEGDPASGDPDVVAEIISPTPSDAAPAATI